jgi:hypothetical protein
MDIFEEIGKQLGEAVGNKGLKLKIDEEQLLRLETQFRELKKEVKTQWRVTQIIMALAVTMQLIGVIV